MIKKIVGIVLLLILALVPVHSKKNKRPSEAQRRLQEKSEDRKEYVSKKSRYVDED